MSNKSIIVQSSPFPQDHLTNFLIYENPQDVVFRSNFPLWSYEAFCEELEFLDSMSIISEPINHPKWKKFPIPEAPAPEDFSETNPNPTTPHTVWFPTNNSFGEIEQPDSLFSTKIGKSNHKKKLDARTGKTKQKHPDGWVKVPTNILTDHHREQLGDDYELALIVLHYLFSYRVMDRKGRHHWQELSSKQMKAIFTWEVWQPLIKKLIRLGYVEVDKEGRGKKGQRCWAYRIAEPLMSKHQKFDLRNAIAQDIIRTHRVNSVQGYNLKHLRHNLHKTTILPVPEEVILKAAKARDEHDRKHKITDEEKAELLREQIDLIKTQCWHFSKDKFSGRIHTNITNLNRDIRPYLRCEDNPEPVQELDIKAAQPLFVGVLARKHDYIDKHFLDVVQDDLYQHLANILNISRAKVKKHLMQRALFSKNDSRAQKHPVWLCFKEEFKETARFIFDMKKDPITETNKKPHNKLARLAQEEEVELVINTVCDRLRRQYPDMWYNTIHDSLMFLPKSAGSVKLVMGQSFWDKYGLCPKLEVRNA